MKECKISQVQRRFQQLSGVRVRRCRKNLLNVAAFDDRSVLHDRDAMRHRPDHGQIVTDKNEAEVVLLLQPGEQFQHLLLDRHVERAGRLIEDQDARFQHQSPRDRNPLTLAAGELMRIAVQHRAVETDFAQDRHLPCRAAPPGLHLWPMQREPYADDPLDGLPRRQRTERVLKDNLHIRA